MGIVTKRPANRYVRNPFCLTWSQGEESTMEKLQIGISGIEEDEEIARELLEDMSR